MALCATGGGAWGTALAAHAARMGHNTVLWAREPDVVASINEQHENTAFLKVCCIRDCGQGVTFNHPTARHWVLYPAAPLQAQEWI
jgi:glycerol-3-phosphate dehydrogenase